nr:unnamed protein product [Callosobruchus analis]
MVLMAIVDAKYRFLLADFGTNGKISDGGVLQNTKFFEKLQNKTLKLPTSLTLKNSTKCLPYVFVADDAFPLRVDMLKPFRQTDLNSRERIWNFSFKVNVQPENIEKIVMATCVLHNFLIEHTPSSYAPRDCFNQENTENGTIITSGYDTTDSNMENWQRRHQGSIMSDAKNVRIEFSNYFVNEGKVPWQDYFI